MRTFPSPRWGTRMLDSPPPSPRDNQDGLLSNSSFDKPLPQRPKSVHFVPPCDEVMSPLETTQPLTPDHSFSQEMAQPVVTPSPVKGGGGGTRIARLASLFASRAIVKSASPPRSDSSSGYVGWPGTQDKRGGTVEVEQSSDSTNEITEKVHRFSSPMNTNVRGLQDIYGQEQPHVALADPWADMEETFSCASTKYSKTSSAYFSTTLPLQPDRHAVAASVMRKSLTEEALRLKDHLTPPHKITTMGYRGLMEKTRDVPNLMDGTDSENSSVSGIASLRKRDPEAFSDIFEGVCKSGDSDVFDGLSNHGASRYLGRTPSIPEHFTLGAIPRNDNEQLNLVLLGGGLTTIQTTANDFSNRKTASDFDENLTNSDYDQYGFAKIPGFNEMATAGKKVHDRALGPQSFSISSATGATNRLNSRSEPGSEVSGSSVFSDQYEVDSWGESIRDGLQQYYVHPDEMKSLVKKFRKMSNSVSSKLNYEEMEREEDATKVFALMEMRSRIMEKDIERGLERRGGTSVVDDMVLTPYNRAAMRVRDALVVAKAWRDGATPKDVVNTATLTRRPERAYFILRTSQQDPWQRSPRYTWEEVQWHDDLELSQYRCHSIGPRHLRGFEMFTIGDCQSILLKLCNEQCLELRGQLNEATALQIEAEDAMKAEEADSGGDGMMTEAEMRYLTSMEEVKTISHKLVLAEKAFNLVRDRIEKLVAKYEALLIKLDNDAESIAPSSVITDASSYYSDYTAGTVHDEREREVLARRAQQAELRAELAAREAMLTKQRAHEFQKEKEMEIQILRQKLNDLQSESSTAIAEREHSVVLARAIAATRRGPGSQLSSVKSNISTSNIEDVKQRFRNRSAGRNNLNPPRPTPVPSRGTKSSSSIRRNYHQDPTTRERSAMLRAVGEEMFQHLDFYERSLKAVDATTY